MDEVDRHSWIVVCNEEILHIHRDLFQRVLHNPIVYIQYKKVNTKSKSEIMNEWRQYGQKNQGQEPEFWLSNVLDIVSQGVPSSLQKAILEKFVIFFFSLKNN